MEVSICVYRKGTMTGRVDIKLNWILDEVIVFVDGVKFTVACLNGEVCVYTPKSAGLMFKGYPHIHETSIPNESETSWEAYMYQATKKEPLNG